MKLNFGISEPDMIKLRSCSVIFHAAATVRFDDPLKDAILVNTRGTRELCKIATTMTNLKVFVHVSTAFVQPKVKYIEEKIFPNDSDWKTYISYAESIDGDIIDMLTPK